MKDAVQVGGWRGAITLVRAYIIAVGSSIPS
jgi:hypothetical protein